MKNILLALLLVVALGCANRVPGPKSAQSITHHYFERYAKKYTDSYIGQGKVAKIEIIRITERQRNQAHIESFVNLQNGQVVRVLSVAKKTPPLGWKIASWEILDLR